MENIAAGLTAVLSLLVLYILYRRTPPKKRTATIRRAFRKLFSLASTPAPSAADQKLLQRIRSSMMPHAAADMEQSPSSSSSSSSSASISSTISSGETPHKGTPSPPCLTPPVSPPPENDEVYLTFNDASITNNQFHYITHTAGQEAFMQDYCLDMALKILAHNSKCSASHIAIASTFESQIFYIAASDKDGWEEYSKLFKDAKWILIPINDGMTGKVNAAIQGAHWSLLAINRVGKMAHYFDSLFVTIPAYHELADTVFHGILNVLGEDISGWMGKVEYNSPNQTQHNRCKDDAWTSCGPFVFFMIEYLVDTIKWAQSMGKEDQHVLDLEETFPQQWGEIWNSRGTRLAMQNSVARTKQTMEAEKESDSDDLVEALVEEVVGEVKLPTTDEAQVP